jgi:hypothetical protein
MKTMTTKKTREYIVTAKRSSGETLFLCWSPTQGERMVPNAQSMASRLQGKQVAQLYIDRLSKQYKGLTFSVEAIAPNL